VERRRVGASGLLGPGPSGVGNARNAGARERGAAARDRRLGPPGDSGVYGRGRGTEGLRPVLRHRQRPRMVRQIRKARDVYASHRPASNDVPSRHRLVRRCPPFQLRSLGDLGLGRHAESERSPLAHPARRRGNPRAFLRDRRGRRHDRRRRRQARDLCLSESVRSPKGDHAGVESRRLAAQGVLGR
jgi:hypothetical protein